MQTVNLKQKQLDALEAKILADKVCPELAQTATQLVFGDGAASTDLVFIGEAPGKNEDLKGKPFVGAAGKFLDEMLAMINLKRPNVYITNIVKYRPPNNRDPIDEEKAAFLPFLQAQLDIIEPKLVITLGRHSLNCFLPQLSITKVHGQPKRIRIKRHESRIMERKPSGHPTTESGNRVSDSTDDSVVTSLVILPLFHPAAALYNGSMRQTLMNDFTKIPKILALI